MLLKTLNDHSKGVLHSANNPTLPSADINKWIHKIGYIHTREYYSAKIRNEILIYATT